MLRSKRSILTCCASLALVHCSGPYSPQPQPSPLPVVTTSDNPVDVLNGARLYPINPGGQACNASISQDQVNYPDCMLWLNANILNVRVPSALSGFLVNIGEWHNRLTVVDSSNTLRWYILKPELGVAAGGELQGPEWSTHPEYLTCVAGEDRTDKNHAAALAIRMTDKAHLRLTKPILTMWGYPHLFVPDSARSTATVAQPQFDQNGLVSRDDVERFFGTTNVKLVFAFQCNTSLRYIDYNEAAPVPRTLSRPAGTESWAFLSALLSPDGKWVVYDCFPGIEEQGSTYRCYLQALQPQAEPILIAEGACDPHWWIDPRDGTCHVIYARLSGHYFVQEDLADPAIQQDSLLGVTCKQRLHRHADGTLTVDDSFGPVTIAPLPMKGGLSADGKLLCTGYQYAYMYKLSD